MAWVGDKSLDALGCWKALGGSRTSRSVGRSCGARSAEFHSSCQSESAIVTGNIATVALLRHGGSHLIRPIVSRLGFEIVEPGNFGAPLDQAVGPVVVFLRDPRDRMVSTLRWWREKPRKADMLGGESG